MRAWIAVATGLALGLRLWGLSADPLWVDEAFTWKVTGLAWREVARAAGDTNCPGYYLLAKASVALFGDGEGALRLPAALLTAAAVPFIALLARRIAGREAAVVAAFLAALAPALVHYGQEARSYALLVFASAATLVAFARALESARTRDAAALGFSGALLLYAHPYGALEVTGLGLIVAGQWLSERRCPRAALFGLALAGALFAPFAVTLLRRATEVAADSWMEPATFVSAARVPRNLFHRGGGDLLTAILAVLVVFAWARLPRPWRRLALVVGSACWIGPALLSRVTSPVFMERYAMGLAPLAIAAVACLVPQAARRGRGAGVLVAVLLLGTTAAAAVRYEATRPHRPDWRTAFAELRRARAEGATPVVFAFGTVSLAAYYFPEGALMVGARGEDGEPLPIGPLPRGRFAVVAAPRYRERILEAASGRPVLHEMPRRRETDRLFLEIGAAE